MSSSTVVQGKNSITMQGVHTIVAFPQWYINYNLEQLVRTGNTSDGKPLKDVNLTIGSSNQWLQGTIDKLWTNIHVNGSNNRVIFILSFSTGTMDYYDIANVPPTPEQVSIAGIQFGFEVDLCLEDIQMIQTVPDNVKKQVFGLLSNHDEGSFTIQQLFMDFQNAVVSQYNPSVTKFPESMPPSARIQFANYLNVYLSQLVSTGGNILGYSLKIHNPGNQPDPKATFPPTDLHFVTNQYNANTTSSLNADYDTLQYLMMTGNTPLPTINQNYWGNYSMPEDETTGCYGTMAISKALFIHQFLLPKLGPLINSYWTFSDNKNSLDANYTVSSGSFTPSALGGTFESGSSSGHSHKTNTWSNDDADYSLSVSTNFSVQPGTNQIVINRTTNLGITTTHWYGIKGHAASNKYSVFYSIPLQITIRLLGINDGKLVVSVDREIHDDSDNTVYGDPYGWFITKSEGEYSIWKSVSDTTDKIINHIVPAASLEAELPQLEQQISESLRLSPFVFPGGNQLFMSDPLFTDNGDLIIGLKYKK